MCSQDQTNLYHENSIEWAPSDQSDIQIISKWFSITLLSSLRPAGWYHQLSRIYHGKQINISGDNKTKCIDNLDSYIVIHMKIQLYCKDSFFIIDEKRLTIFFKNLLSNVKNKQTRETMMTTALTLTTDSRIKLFPEYGGPLENYWFTEWSSK